jgi:type IV pilus assembly protein PilY1
LGTGQSTSASYTGLRFTGITIPRNAVITSAYLEVYSTQNQWITIGFQVYGDNTGNSSTFTMSTKPSQRSLTAQWGTYSANTQWLANQWYQIPSLAPVVQALINRSDWQSGNALTLILKGTSGQYGRKVAQSYDSDPSFAPRLVITYQ